MKKRLYSGAIFIAILALAFVLKATVSNYFFDALVLFVACLGGWECSKIFTKMGKFNNKTLSFIQPVFMMGAILLCLGYQNKISLIYTVVIAIASVLMFSIITFLWAIIDFKNTKNEMQTRKITCGLVKFSVIKAVNTTIVFIYPAFLLMFLTLINHIGEMTNAFACLSEKGNVISLFILLFTFLIPIISDTFAYLVGGLIGGKKLAPKISPNKTISGAVGGIVFAVLLSIVLFVIFNAIPSVAGIMANAGISMWKIAIMAFFGSCIGQCGDLFESFLKRKAGVKDSGKIMPGHGGILDRFDSHIFVAPFVFIAFCILFVLI